MSQHHQRTLLNYIFTKICINYKEEIKKVNTGGITSHELRIIMLIRRGLRLTDTAAVTVANRLPPKYMYVSRILCFTVSGHILNKHPVFIRY